MNMMSIIERLNIHSQGGWGYGMGPGMMGGYGGYGYGMGYGPVGTIIVAIVVAAAVIGTVFLIRSAIIGTKPQGSAPHDDDAMEILRKRFANGDIDKEEFEDRKKALKS